MNYYHCIIIIYCLNVIRFNFDLIIIFTNFIIKIKIVIIIYFDLTIVLDLININFHNYFIVFIQKMLTVFIIHYFFIIKC